MRPFGHKEEPLSRIQGKASAPWICLPRKMRSPFHRGTILGFYNVRVNSSILVDTCFFKRIVP